MSVILKLLLALTSASLAAIFAVVSLAVGLECIRRSRLSASLGIVARLGLAFALGHMILGILMQLCAVFGAFNRTLIAIIFTAAIAFGWRSLQDLVGELRAAVPTHSVFSATGRCWVNDPVHTIAVAATSACLLAGVLPLFVTFYGPPAVDALAYYLAQGKLIAFTNDLSPISGYEAFQVLSYAAEMPFAAMYLFGGETVGHFAAKATIVPVALATLALMWVIAGACGLQLLGKTITCLLLMTSSSYLLVSFDGKSDLVSNLYAVAAIFSLLSASRANTRASAVFFGVLSGGAMIAKFSLFVVLPPAFAVALAARFWGRWKDMLKYIAVGAAAAAIVLIAGWIVKNLALFGDPFVPLYRFALSTPEFPTGQVWYSSEVTDWITTTYPLALTFGRYPMQYGQISIGWLLFLPCFVTLGSWKNKTSLALLAGGLLGIATWVYMRPSILAPRYILPAISMGMFAFAYAAETAFNKSSRRTIALLAVGTLCVTASLFAVASAYYRVTLAVSYYASYVSETPWLPELHRAQVVNRLPIGEQILFLSYKNEYLRGDLLANFLPAKSVGAVISDPESFWSYLDDNEIRYVVVDRTHPMGRLVDVKSAPPGYEIDEVEFLADHYYLYEIKRTK